MLTSDNPRYEDPFDIILQIEEGMRPLTQEYVIVVDRESAIGYALDMLRQGDVLLIAGKGGRGIRRSWGSGTFTATSRRCAICSEAGRKRMKTELLLLLVSGAASAALCALLIPLLRRRKAEQYILGYVREHSGKRHADDGGLAFVCAAAAVAAAFGLYADKRAAVAAAFGAAYAAVGFLDDFLKAHYKRNLGLRAYQKIVFQLALALIAGLYCYFGGDDAAEHPVLPPVL